MMTVGRAEIQDCHLGRVWPTERRARLGAVLAKDGVGQVELLGRKTGDGVLVVIGLKVEQRAVFELDADGAVTTLRVIDELLEHDWVPAVHEVSVVCQT